jgi:hypothetical protein
MALAAQRHVSQHILDTQNANGRSANYRSIRELRLFQLERHYPDQRK